MEVLEENEGIMSKSPQILAQGDLHLVMAAVLEASAGQNFKICLGSSSGKTQRSPSKLQRAGHISSLKAISSPVMAETVLVSPQFFAPHLHAVVAEALVTSACQNLKISLGSVGKTQRATTIEVEKGGRY